MKYSDSKNYFNHIRSEMVKRVSSVHKFRFGQGKWRLSKTLKNDCNDS